MTKGTPLCIECGGLADSLNEDEHGDPCPACAERLLESLPGVFHSPWVEAGHGAAASEEASQGALDSRGEPSGPGQESPGGGSSGEPRGSA